jgi:PhnB protein
MAHAAVPAQGGDMTVIETRERDEAEIRRRLESWTAALRAKDVEGVLSHYAPDIVAFDLAPPLQHRRDAIRKGLAGWFPTWVGPIGYEVRELAIILGDEVAFTHSVNRLTGKRTGGESADVWLRATVGLRKLDGAWMIVHEHASVPFYMDGSYRAAVDLVP